MQSSFKTETDVGIFGVQTQFDLVGSSFQNEALRFGQLRDKFGTSWMVMALKPQTR